MLVHLVRRDPAGHPGAVSRDVPSLRADADLPRRDRGAMEAEPDQPAGARALGRPVADEHGRLLRAPQGGPALRRARRLRHLVHGPAPRAVAVARQPAADRAVHAEERQSRSARSARSRRGRRRTCGSTRRRTTSRCCRSTSSATRASAASRARRCRSIRTTRARDAGRARSSSAGSTSSRPSSVRLQRTFIRRSTQRPQNSQSRSSRTTHSGGLNSMKRRILLAVGVALVATACSAPPKTAATVLQDAQKALGPASSIQYTGTGMSAFVGQALTAGEPWPARELSSFTETINYDQKSAQAELNFAQPTFGGQQQNTEVNGDKAWNVGPNGPVPQLATAEARQLLIWLTPHGFVKAGLAATDATLSGTETAPVISFTTMGKYKLVGTLDAQNMVTKIETKRPDTVLGDAEVVATFSDYKDFGGVKFPAKIAISDGGFPSWEFNTTKVTPNAPADLPVPEAVQAATIPPVQVDQHQDGRRRVAPGRRLAPQRRRRVQGLHRDRGSAAQRGAFAGRAGRSEEARAQQARQVPADDASSLRSHGRPAHLRRRGRDDRHQPVQRRLLREDVDGPCHDGSGLAGEEPQDAGSFSPCPTST